MNEEERADRDQQVKAAPWATTKKYEAGSEDNAMNVLKMALNALQPQ